MGRWRQIRETPAENNKRKAGTHRPTISGQWKHSPAAMTTTTATATWPTTMTTTATWTTTTRSRTAGRAACCWQCARICAGPCRWRVFWCCHLRKASCRCRRCRSSCCCSASATAARTRRTVTCGPSPWRRLAGAAQQAPSRTHTRMHTPTHARTKAHDAHTGPKSENDAVQQAKKQERETQNANAKKMPSATQHNTPTPATKPTQTTRNRAKRRETIAKRRKKKCKQDAKSCGTTHKNATPTPKK